MNEVWMVQHVSHAVSRDGTQNDHVGEDGELFWDEEDGDNIKLIGIYSAEHLARAGGRSSSHASRIR